MDKENIVRLSSLDEDVLTALGGQSLSPVEIHRKLVSIERPTPLSITSIYPALDRLEQKAFVVTAWEEGRRLCSATNLGSESLKSIQEYREKLRNLEKS